MSLEQNICHGLVSISPPIDNTRFNYFSYCWFRSAWLRPKKKVFFFLNSIRVDEAAASFRWQPDYVSGCATYLGGRGEGGGALRLLFAPIFSLTQTNLLCCIPQRSGRANTNLHRPTVRTD